MVQYFLWNGGMHYGTNSSRQRLVSPCWGDSVYWDSFYSAQRFFIEEFIGEGTAPLSTLDDAIAARCIIDAAIPSLQSKAFVDVSY
jgi:hypothetical protein